MLTCLPLIWLSLLAAVDAPGLHHSAPIFDIPYIGGITVDGDPADWFDRGFQVRAMLDRYGRPTDPSVFDASFRLAWDERGLLFTANVVDIAADEATDDQLWMHDAVELFIGDEVGGLMYFQAVVSPGLDTRRPGARHVLLDRRPAQHEPLNLEFGVRPTSNGYTIEVRSPWRNIGVSPRDGAEVAFQVFFNNHVAPEKDPRGLTHLIWYPAVGTTADSARMHRIRLSRSPSPPVLAAARSGLFGTDPLMFEVVATEALSGRTLELTDGGKAQAAVPLHEVVGRRSTTLIWRQPAESFRHRWLSLRAGGQVVGWCLAGDAYAAGARSASSRPASQAGARSTAPAPGARSAAPPPPAKPVRGLLVILTVILGGATVAVVIVMLIQRRRVRIDDL